MTRYAKTILLCLLAALGVAALLILVPTSPALLVDQPEVLWSSQVDEWGTPSGLLVTKYALCIALGAAAAILLTAYLSPRAKLRTDEALSLSLLCGGCALVCSHLLYCILRWSYIYTDLTLNDLGATFTFLYRFWQGGYTMYGAILGALLGLVIYGRATKRPLLPLMDLIVPGMALVILLGRAGEGFTMQGMSSETAAEALTMIPFAGLSEWESPQLAVYPYEAIMAGLALMCSLAGLAKGRPAGRAAETGLTLISLGQVIFESWRGDELITFGFVRLNMILAAVVLVTILAGRVLRTWRQGRRVWPILRTAVFLACAGTVIAIEFALDKSDINNTLLYGVMAATLCLMGATVLVADGRASRKQGG